ncbi:polyphosphate--glucose phosphotransferase [Kocuria sp. M1R5S2]|uniref:polyphosphate--glucose phosphotransferase n=1 Tax=Kocuria rhizosphaerae TaxID=3376285 RepID=UPI0037ADD10D
MANLSPRSTAAAPAGWSTLHRHHIGVDVGGSTMKYAVVDVAGGSLTTPVTERPTPAPSTPDAVAHALSGVVEELSARPEAPDPEASVGVAIPAIVRNGVACSAAHIDDAWLGLDVRRFLSERLGRTVQVINDADAAGLAEVRYGAGRSGSGTVLLITLGTGIGSALIVDGKLVPNLELGHVELDGLDAEVRAAAVAREREHLDWAAYAERLQRYLAHLEFLFSPDLIIVGGDISARHEEFLPRLHLRTPVVVAELRNSAGIVGAARHAYLTLPPLDD